MAMAMATTSESADRISQLPEQILHHILSFLPTPDLVCLSVLSKEWYRTFSCFPQSNFSDSFTSGAVDRRLEFATFVFNSLLRQCRHNVSIPKFQLSVNEQHFFSQSTPPQLRIQLRNLVDRSIGLSARKGVKEVSIEFPLGIRYLSKYRLPKAIFSAKELAVLRLAGCNLTTAMKIPSLRELSLKHVYVYEQKIIDNLIFTCPFIEKNFLTQSSGISYLKLSGFTKLRKVKVNDCLGVEKIEIDALSLRTFSYNGGYAYVKEPRHFYLTSCKNLEVFKFKHGKLTDNIIQDINSEFPALKVLVLHDFQRMRIQISCPRLEKLQLISTYYPKAKAAVINAPRLQSFKHSFKGIPSFFSINETMLREVSLELCLDEIYDEHGDGFLKSLQKYFGNFNQVNVFVTLHITGDPYSEIHQVFSGMQKLVSNMFTPFLLGINRVELKTDFPNKYYPCEELVDDLFWLCHPESFLLEPAYCTNYEFIKDLYKKLVGRGEHQNCCSDTQVKCWRHDLKSFRIKHIGENGHKKVLECDALSDPLQTLVPDIEKICFVFEW